MKKRGMELTISTLVVIILALMMLIVGTIIVKKTYCAAITGVTSMDDLTRQQIMNLFSQQDNKVAVKELENEISRGIYYGVGFIIENEDKITSAGFSYNINAIDLGDCPISEQDAEDYIVSGNSGTATIAAGDTFSDVVEFMVPKDAPLCSLKYQIEVEKNGEFYGSARFQVIIKKASAIGTAMC